VSGTHQWVVIYGDPIEGFTYYGPFSTLRQAVDIRADGCWIAPLIAPDDTENE
jgi:hypothetical protein